MGANNWKHIESLFHAALRLDGGERGAYLTRACAGDDSLRREVESLIAAFEGYDGFIDEPTVKLGLCVLSDPAGESMAGETIGPYKILRLLGRGGMGEVYLAEDTRLGRKVALKFLSGKLLNDNWAKRQLVKEAQAVAMLDHRNICTVHGMEEAGGRNFIVMQYIEGRPLTDLILDRFQDTETVLQIAEQIVNALSEAHAHGIIHRDIKPQNILVTADGQVKVLDFGLAKFIPQKQGLAGGGDQRSETSKLGLIVGTVAYTSPEQLRGERLDYRSDIFSCGTVLYEMISGKNPFARGSMAETISAILSTEPPPLRSVAPGASHEISRIIHRCLKPDRDQRYPSASDLSYDIESLRRGAKTSNPENFYSNHRVAAIITVLLLVAAACAFTYSRLTRVRTIAVLPIVNESNNSDIEYLSAGLTESLVGKLSGLSKLRVKALKRPPEPAAFDALKIGRDLKVEAVLVGTLTRRGELFVVQTELLDAADGSKLWGREYGVNLEQIFDLQRDVTENVAASLGLRLEGGEENLWPAGRTKNPEALQRYMLGRYYLNRRSRENIRRAIAHFEEAIVLDPSYAEARAGIADCYVLLPSVAYGHMPTDEAMRRAKGEANTALTINDRLPEAHTSAGVVQLRYEWNWQEAERAFQRAIELNPDYAPAHYWYSNLLAITGRHEEAMAESAVAKQLEPDSPSAGLNQCRTIFLARRYDGAVTCFKKMLAEEPDDINAWYMLGLVYRAKGMSEEATGIFQKLYESEGHKLYAAPQLGYCYAKAGRREEAMKILSDLEEASKHDNLPAQEVAVIHVGLGDVENAFAWLEKAHQDRYAPLTYINVEPLFDGLRSDPRFTELVRRLQLPAE